MIYIYFKINYRIQITSEMVGKKVPGDSEHLSPTQCERNI